MRCPIINANFDGPCRNTKCLLNSQRHNDNCAYGTDMTAATFAKNKDIKVAAVRAYINKVEELTKRAFFLLTFAEFCKEQKDYTDEDKMMWEEVSEMRPYNTSQFQFININLFARMRTTEAWNSFCEKYPNNEDHINLIYPPYWSNNP